jgi:hypothetical protein
MNPPDETRANVANTANTASIANTETELALLNRDIQYIREKITEINTKLEQRYITREEFEPIKKIVYGVVGIMLTGMVVALIALIIGKGGG